MAKRFSPVSSSSFTMRLTMTLPLMSNGTMTKLTMKERVRTAARYSRMAMTINLRMGVRLRFRCCDADEDIVQGRPGQLEVLDLAKPHEVGQHLLGIGVSFQTQLPPAPAIGNLYHARQILPPQPSPTSGGRAGRGAAVQPDPKRISAIGGLNGFQGAVKNLLALVNHEDEVAHFLRDRHVVGGKDNGGSLAAEIQNRFAKDFGVDRVQTGERLVQEEQLRFGHHRGDELDLLGHAFGQRL